MTNTSTGKHLAILSQLLLAPGETADFARAQCVEMLGLLPEDREPLLALAGSHHVVVRAVRVLQRIAEASGSTDWAEWAGRSVEHELLRIRAALQSLQSVCDAFREEDCDLTVIKSLDHWPDLGSDLDLYTNADPVEVLTIMAEHFQARLEARSWGDRLANKWNFVVPHLNELIEIHVGRLGQTGEHVAFAQAIPSRAIHLQAGAHNFSVACPEHRLIIATLQRMYRHFYLRLCDVVDTVQLLETQPISYQLLKSAADAAGIWEGVATLLCIVSDYAESYRGVGIALPDSVRSCARLSGDRVSFQKGFLRVPILPESVGLYASELATLMRNGQIRGSLRLSLLPCLATAAMLEQKLTGSDKGIW